MAVSETNTKVDRLADKKAILRKRGVPEKFVQGIAQIDSADQSQDKAMRVAFLTTLGPFAALTVAGMLFKKHVVNMLFASEISHSDMFISGQALVVAWIWALASLGVLLPYFVCLMTPREVFRYGLRGEVQPVRPMAFWLCSRQGRRLDDIAADPRIATLGDFKTAKAFLEAFGALMTPGELDAQDRAERRTRLRGVLFFAAWLPVTIAIGAWAMGNYTRIDHGVIRYASLESHFTVPLAQVTEVDAYCYYTGKHHDHAKLAYDIAFKDHSIDLFKTDNLRDDDDAVNRMVRIDTYLNGLGVPMHKSKPFDQLQPREQRCLDDERLSPPNDDPKRHQLIFEPVSGGALQRRL